MSQKNLKKLRICRYVLVVVIIILALVAVFLYRLEQSRRVHEIEAEQSTMWKNTSDATKLSVDPTDKAASSKAVLYDNTSGLPTSEANAIVETSEGFIWIGSYAGLIRYDGNSFERVDSVGGITSVICLFVDSEDRLWVGTNANGVAVMDQGETKMWGKKDGLRADSVRAITEDKDGLIYVATTDGISTIDADGNISAITDAEIEHAYIQDMRIGAGNVIYGLTQSGDLFTLKDGKLGSFWSADVTGISGALSFLPDSVKKDYLYLGTDDAMVYYGKLGETFEMESSTDVAPLTNIERLEYLDGSIWICAGNGAGRLGEDGLHLLQDVPMDNSIGHVMMDYAGNLWFTSSRQGVMKIVANQFTDIFETYKLDPAVVNTTCKVDDLLYVGTDDGLTVISSVGVLKSLPLSSAATASGQPVAATDLIAYLKGARIRSIIEDSSGKLWISTWRSRGLICYSDSTITVFKQADGLFSDQVRVVSEQSDGTLLVANTGGVNVISGNQIIQSYGEEDGIENTSILTVLEGENGDILMGSDGGGIYIIGQDGTRHIGMEEGLGSEVVMRITKDPNRDLYWIVTTNSIAYMDSDYQVTTVENFPYPNNFDIYVNGNDDVWVMASDGIYIVSAEELLGNEEMDPLFCSLENGLPCITTANSYSDLEADGTLYIAGMTGVASVNIEGSMENISNLKASVPYIEVDGEVMYPDDSGVFVVSSDSDKISIPCFVFNYSLVNPEVLYKLDGFDKSVTVLNRKDLKSADYTNLKGGTYYFILQVKDSIGGEVREFTVKIVKEKAFYEQAWFYLVLIIIAALVIAGITRWYVKKKTRELEKKAKENRILINEITEAFAKTIDMKDEYTNGHSTRVAEYTVMLARELGYDEETVEQYYHIALLHDIGKIGVPGEVLNKAGKLTEEEFQIIQSHTKRGFEALQGIHIMPDLAIGAEAHHERPDGKGYPLGLKQDEIPRAAQIIAVADTFDAMYSNRPYRNRMNFEKAVSIIRDAAGTQLTADVVDAFLRLVDRGFFRAPDDHGGGTTEDIQNIHEHYEK